MKGLIAVQYNNIDCQFNEQGWFNATQASKQFGKRPNDWLNLSDTKIYIQALSEHLNISDSKLLIKTKKGGNTDTILNGIAQGTWLHPKLAVAFSRWLDTRFGIWCDLQIDSLIHGNHPILDKHRLRHQTASTYKAVTTLLKRSREQQGKETKPHHYTNEARLINWAITGQFTGLDRDSLSYEELDLLAELEAQDLILIGSQCNYDERKKALSLFAQNFKTSRSILTFQSNSLKVKA